jgi:hypothetical protein
LIFAQYRFSHIKTLEFILRISKLTLINTIRKAFSYTWQSNRKLVARRGFAVQLTLTCTEAYENQPVILQFDLGNITITRLAHNYFNLDNGNASNDRETQRQVRLDCQQKPSKANKDDVIYWEIKELKFEENFIHIEVKVYLLL